MVNVEGLSMNQFMLSNLKASSSKSNDNVNYDIRIEDVLGIDRVKEETIATDELQEGSDTEENKNSDIDLLVKISKHKGMGLDLIRFERELQKKLNKKIDTVSENGVHHLLKEQIFKESVSL